MRNRTIQFNVRLNETEARALKNASKITGLSQATVLRQLVAGQTLKPLPPDSYTDLTHAVSAIGNNINQIAHKVNATQTVTPEQLTEVQKLLEDIWLLLAEQA